MFIDLFLSGLVAGYQQIRGARRTLLDKWRFLLLHAYSQKRDRHQKLLDQVEARRVAWRRVLPWAVIGVAALCVWGFWTVFSDLCLGSVLLAIPFLGSALFGAGWFLSTRDPDPPEHPLGQDTYAKYTSPLKQILFPELLPLWRQRFAVHIPFPEEVDRLTRANQEWGLIGEFDVVRQFARIVPLDTFILHRLQQNHGDDLDVVLIGPKGIWYFEVKHYNATFDWRNGKWSVWQTDRKTGATIQVKMSQDPDAQWTRMRADLLKTLTLRGRDWLAKHPRVAEVQGGIVFSNENVTVNIQPNAPFAWGNIAAWVENYHNAPRLSEMTPEVIYWLTETVLKRHQELNPEHKVHSMTAHAAKVIRDVETKIQTWISAG